MPQEKAVKDSCSSMFDLSPWLLVFFATADVWTGIVGESPHSLLNPWHMAQLPTYSQEPFQYSFLAPLEKTQKTRLCLSNDCSNLFSSDSRHHRSCRPLLNRSTFPEKVGFWKSSGSAPLNTILSSGPKTLSTPGALTLDKYLITLNELADFMVHSDVVLVLAA